MAKAEELWAGFEAWAGRMGIPLRDDAAPPDWLIACYVMLRLTDPTTSPGGSPVKLKTAENIANSLKKYARLQGWDITHLRGKATKITSVMTAAERLLPESQVTTVQSRPITAVGGEEPPAELDLLLDHLKDLDRQPAVSTWWVCGWRANILTGIQGPLRGGETVTAAISNLRQAKASDGSPTFILTIPVSKWKRDPKDLVFFCVCGEGRDRRCPVHALTDWLAVLADNGYQGDALFPTTPRYDPRLDPPQRTGPIRLGNTDGLHGLAADIRGDDVEMEALGDSVDLEFDFTCRLCSTTEHETLRARASRKYACRSCGARAMTLAKGHLYERTGDGEVAWFADAVAERLADPGFRPGREWRDRHLHAIKQAQNRQRYQLQELCRGAGIAPRHQFESITFHGLKRGGVTTLAMKGVSDVQLQAFAQHGSMNDTTVYIDRFRPLPHATSYLEPWKGDADVCVLGHLDRAIRPEDADQAT